MILGPASLLSSGCQTSLSHSVTSMAGAQTGLVSLHEGVHGAYEAVYRIVDTRWKIFRLECHSNQELQRCLSTAHCYRHPKLSGLPSEIFVCITKIPAYCSLIDGDRRVSCKGRTPPRRIGAQDVPQRCSLLGVLPTGGARFGLSQASSLSIAPYKSS